MSLYYLFLYIIVFVYGITIGSFLNVCIYRLPKKESIVTVGSHCMKCNKPIKWYDLVPLFSFIVLGGKCRYCKTKLSFQYPLIEGLNGVLYVLVFAMNGFSLESGIYCLLTSALLTLSIIDYRTYEIPFGINLFIGVLGVLHIVIDYENWIDYVVGFFAVSLFLLLCYWITKGRGIGGGDVKLMAVAGLCVGWQNILFALVAGCLIGSVIQIFKMIVTKEGRMFAFGPYLSMGIFLSIFYGEAFFTWYLSLMGH